MQACVRWNEEALLNKTVVAPPPNGHWSTTADDELRRRTPAKQQDGVTGAFRML
jgi:hypothetical protein